MSHEYVTNSRWCLGAGSTGRPVKIDEMDAELEQIARFRCKTSEENKSDYLAEKFRCLRVGELPNVQEQHHYENPLDNLQSCETFTDLSASGRCSLLLSFCY